MALNFRAPSRALLESLRPGHRRSVCECLNAIPARQHAPSNGRRSASTASAQLSEMEVDGSAPPRWSRTPPAMKAPVSLKFRPADHKPFKTNTDPTILDNMYQSLLGKGGDQLLSVETKWLAVTHKSFDQGRRGFNERLAYLGKRIVELQLSLGMLNHAGSTKSSQQLLDPHGRQPFQHPATDNIEILTHERKRSFLHHRRLHKLAERHGMQHVVRWHPKDPENLSSSGVEMVYAQSMYAIIGAIALERGGAIANEIARERILLPLGVTTAGVVEEQ